MFEKKYISCTAEIKALEKEGTFEGYGSVFGNVDSYKDIVAKGAFQESLERNGLPALLLQHKSEDIGGVYVKAEETEHGLKVVGELNMEVQKAREAYALMKQGALRGLSIGFVTKEDSYDRETGIRTIKKVDLLEISLVTFPANTQALVTSVKSVPKTEREFEEFLRDAGYGRTQSKAIISGGFKSYLDMQRDADNVDNSDNVLRDADEDLKSLAESLKEIKQCLTSLKKSKNS